MINDSTRGANIIGSQRFIWDGNTFTGSDINCNFNGSGQMRFVNNTVITDYGETGITVMYQSGDLIQDNDISGSLSSGLNLYQCDSETISGNRFLRSGIMISGDLLENWNTHSIDTTNTVNGNAIRYYKDQVTGTIGASSGQIILANCSRVGISNQVINSTNIAVQIAFSDNTTVSDSDLSGNWQGIIISRSKDMLIGNVTIDDSIWIPFHLTGGGWSTIANSRIHNSTYGLVVMGSYNNTIKDNEFTDLSFSPVRLLPWGGKLPEHNIINGNHFNNSYNGIDIMSSNDTSIIDNEIRNSSGSGINIGESYPYPPASNVFISGNVMLNNSIAVFGGRNTNNLTISENTLTHNDETGVLLISVLNSLVGNNTIHNNSEIGINLFMGNNLTIHGNYVANNSMGGFIIEQTKGSTISNNTIVGLKHQYDGIYLNTVTDTSIHSNFILNHSIGLSAHHSDSILIYNNHFDNDINVGSLASSTNLIWNISKTNGTNILGGNILGGNYWNDYTGLDLDGDWIGDQLLPHGPGDYLPLQYDLIPPTLTDNTSSGIAYTGDNYDFSVIVEDERAPERARLEWWIGDGTIGYKEMDREPTNISSYNTTLTLPMNEIGRLSYRFTAWDGGGNPGMVNGTSSIEVLDNDPPEFLTESFLERILIGVKNPVDVVVKDNIGISLVQLSFIDVRGDEYTFVLDPEGNDIYSGDIPAQELRGTVTFWFTGRDTSGNTLRSPDLAFTVIDNIPPAVAFISPMNGSVVSDGVELVINVTDPIGTTRDVIVTIDGPLSQEIYNRTAPGDIITINWDTSALPGGVYTIWAIAIDDIGNMGRDFHKIIVDHTLPIPVINGTFDIFVDTTVWLDAEMSSDEYGIASIRWGKGSYSPTATETHTGTRADLIYREPGEYNVWLEVIDNAGNVNWTGVTIKVYLPPGPRVVLTSPADGQTGVLVDTDIVITFDLQMDRSSLERSIEIVPFEPHTYRWDNDSRVITIIIPGGLDHETKYWIFISDGAAEDSRVSRLQPFNITFTTENSPPPPSLIIASPTTNGDYFTGMTLSVSGISYYLDEGTLLTIRIEDRTWNTEVGWDGSWRVDAILPSSPNSYRVTVEGGGANAEVTIDVRNAPRDKTTISESLLFFIISLVLLLALILGYVIWRKNRDKEFVFEDWEE